MWIISTALVVLASSASSFLFLLRVRAVYENAKLPTVFFSLFWLGIPVMYILLGTSGHPKVCPLIGFCQGTSY